MNQIQKIICCCGNGLGSSMIVQMNVEILLKQMGLHNIAVRHTSITEVNASQADLFVVGLDIEPQMKTYPRVIILKDLVNLEELKEKLLLAFSYEDNTFHIK